MDKRILNVQQALEWAFRTECAQLELADRREAEDRGTGFGMEYVLLQRARLGTHIDGRGPGSSPMVHEDAEAIAAVVSNLPSRRMAGVLAECGRTGVTPDWWPGARPKIEPREWGNANQFGHFGKTERIGVFIEKRKFPHPRSPQKFIIKQIEHEIRYTPCTWKPSQQEIDSVRGEYEGWWEALDEVRTALESMGLRTIQMNRWMPPRRPWKTREVLSTRAGGSPRGTSASRRGRADGSPSDPPRNA